MRVPKLLGVVAVGVALAMTAAACSNNSGDNNSKPAHSALVIKPTGTGKPYADARAAAEHMPMTAKVLATGLAKAKNIQGDPNSPASDLRANLTALLQEHVYLAGIAVDTAYVKGANSAEFKAAAAAVNANADDTAKAVTTIVGSDQGKQFGEGFKAHIQNFVQYAVAAKSGDTAGKQKAVDSLLAYAKTQGEFWNTNTKGALSAADVEKAFDDHITGVAKAVDAFAAGNPQGFELLRAAADHMPMMAQTLATGIVKATGMKGDPNSPAADLRANLTSLLQEHVYLAGTAVFTAYTTQGGTDSDAFKASAAVLDENSVDLSKAVGSLSDSDHEKTFLEVWRTHIGNFVDYAKADAAGDQKGKENAIKNLDAYRGQAGKFFAEISNGNLKADAIASDLKMHIASLAGAIDSMAAALVK